MKPFLAVIVSSVFLILGCSHSPANSGQPKKLVNRPTHTQPSNHPESAALTATSQTTSSPSTPAVSNKIIRIATYNINSNINLTKKFDQILTNLNSANPDIIFLQEVNRKFITKLAKTLNMNYQLGPYAPKWDMGIGILSHYPIKPVKLFSMKDERNFAIAAKVKIDGKDILVVAVHLKSLPRPLVAGFFRSMGPHQEQAKMILDLVKSQKLPVIVGGDLNTLSFTPEFLLLTSELKDTSTSVGTGTQPSIFVNGIGYRIDHIFTRGPFSVKKCQVSPLPGSDHRMVWTELIYNHEPNTGSNPASRISD
jgi:endonuclease/exonuclease/phosphatase (EEP) superfamily protein YafD